MERREFLRTVALAGLASTFKFSDAMDILAQSGKNVKTGADVSESNYRNGRDE